MLIINSYHRDRKVRKNLVKDLQYPREQLCEIDQASEADMIAEIIPAIINLFCHSAMMKY